MSCLRPYTPINTLKPVTDDVWIVDGPEIRMNYLGIGVPFTTRMTVVRLPDGGLWLHSPTPVDEDLVGALAVLGAPHYLIAPNRLHTRWIGDWKARFPEAIACAAPDARKRASLRFGAFDAELGAPPAKWSPLIEQVPVAGDFMTEVVFFHCPSRALIITDLIQNLEPDRIGCWHWRLLMKLDGVIAPDGQTPYDLRVTFRRHRAGVGAAVARMIAWQPERVLLAHGRCYRGNAEAELRRAFRWAL